MAVLRDGSILNLTVMDEIVLILGMSPFVSMKSAIVPTLLPALSEVFSPAVLAGGGGGSLLRQPPWQWLRQSQRVKLIGSTRVYTGAT